MISVCKLSAPLGARIEEVNLSELAGETERRELRAALFEHQVLVVPGQMLEPGQFARFARLFGHPEPHVLSHLRHPEHPEILSLSNVFVDGEPTGVYDGAAYWHTDMSYEDVPGAVTLVNCLQTPSRGGDTRFSNMFQAYEDLPESSKRRIEGMTVLHHYGNREDLTDSSRTSAFPLSEAQKRHTRNVFHSLVMAHPATGRKALYGVAGASFGIVGLPDDEAFDLLDELKAHATREEFVYQHRYSVGEVVAWDNFSTLHAATLIPPATGPDDTRLLHRISVKNAGADRQRTLE